MPFSNSGVFTPAVTFTDGTLATAEDQNDQDQDIANGLTACLTRGGLSAATANISLGGFKLTNIANGTNPGDAVSFAQVSAINPSGEIIAFAGATLPSGFLFCDGSAVSRTTYASLFAAIGTLWGAGDGTTTFNLPDLRGRTLAGADNMNGSAAGRLTGYSLAVAGGEQTHTLDVNELANHGHSDGGHGHAVTDPEHDHGYQRFGSAFAASSGSSSEFAGANVADATSASATGISIQTGFANITTTGGNAAHNNIQPTAAINYLIRT